MNHCGTRLLETPRLVLRRFETADAPAMYKNWASDPEVTRFLTWPPHASADVTRALLCDWVARYAKPDFYQWVIVPREFGEPVGSISAVEINDLIGKVHVGYCIGRPWWRKGVTSEALRAVIGFFFDEVGANRLEARHDPRNPRSGDVMRACGMKYEGTLRAADRNNQGVCDACWYGILRNERSEGDVGATAPSPV